MVRASTFRLATAVAAVVLATGCTGGDDEPQRGSDHSSGVDLGLGGNLPDTTVTPRLADLQEALAAVPASVLYASYTDVAAVKHELGFAGVDSRSPAGERLAFWEAARASGTMLTGMRLYDDNSQMADEYGWTADDVDWEIDFAGNETGCTEDMLCDPSGGSVIALRDDIGSRTVVQSLAANGFVLESGGDIWSSDKAGEPFTRAIYFSVPNEIVLGNDIGLIRVSDVASGAPSLAEQIPTLAGGLGSPLSAYIDTTGCVSVGEALGPDATDRERTRFVEANEPSLLATGDGWAVTIDSGRAATSFLSLDPDQPAPPPVDERARRLAILDGWASIQAGVDLRDVATAAEVTVDSSIEQVDYDVSTMPTFAAMVLTHDAPWALCATSAPT